MSYLNKIAKMIASPISQHVKAIVSREMRSHRQQMDDMMILQGRALALKNTDRSPLVRLQDAEFKFFSQFGEDGILQYLIRETGITRKETTFIEFGVQNYSEANTRFLLMNDYWRGMIIDGNKQYIDSVNPFSIPIK